MVETLRVVLACAAGAVLGIAFFGSLWWTVRKGVVSHRPALWFLGGTAVRTSLALGGFYVVGAHDFARLMSCLAGFVVGRVVVTRLTRPRSEAPHAS